MPETLEEDVSADPKQKKRKQFSHPSDDLVACILALQCRKIRQGWSWVSVGLDG